MKIIKKIIVVNFWIGVNIIGIPIFHTHKGALLKDFKYTIYPK